MTLKLFVQAMAKMLLGILMVCLLIFIPAGTIKFFNGWLFVISLFVPMFLAGVVMMFKSPELLKRRLDINETENEQKLVIVLSAIMFVLGFVVAGFGFRFGWYMVSKTVVAFATVMFFVSYVLYGEVLKQNPYLSRTIKVCAGQKVIDSGLYGIVRHPMYSVTLIMFLSVPLMLGSLYSFFIFLAYPFIIAKRIKSEEKFLETNLDGYIEYKKKVKYRLIPFIW